MRTLYAAGEARPTATWTCSSARAIRIGCRRLSESSASRRSSRRPSCGAIGRFTQRSGPDLTACRLTCISPSAVQTRRPRSSGRRFALTRLPSALAESRRRSPTQQALRCRGAARRTPRRRLRALQSRLAAGPRPAFGADVARGGRAGRPDRRDSGVCGGALVDSRGRELAARLGLPSKRPVDVELRASSPPPLALGLEWLARTRELGRRPGSSRGPRFRPPAPCGPGGLGRGAGDAGSRSPM